MERMLTTIATLLFVSVGADPASIYDFKVNDIKGNPVDMAQYKGKTLLILNTASQCGHTDAHLKALKRLHEILSYGSKFEILAFPSNDFGEQEPWEATEIDEFVKQHHKCEFPVFEKVRITGEDAHPFWKHIIATSKISPTWNFQKYLYSHKGEYVNSWDANTSVEQIFDAVKEQVDATPSPDPEKEDSNKIEL